MGVLDEAIREHLDLKRRRGASDDEIARAEAEALGPARRAPYDDDDEGVGVAETVVIPPVHDPAPPPPPATPTRAVHDIDEDLMPPPMPGARVERPDLEAPEVNPLDQDTAEHPPPSDQLPFDEGEGEADPPPAAPDAEDGAPGRVSE
jgi:hypothetical protein